MDKLTNESQPAVSLTELAKESISQELIDAIAEVEIEEFTVDDEIDDQKFKSFFNLKCLKGIIFIHFRLKLPLKNLIKILLALIALPSMKKWLF